MHNTEDKQWWVIEWAKREVLFVEKVCPELGLLAGINPEKSSNRYAPDLVVSGLIADLKCQQTPFFKARDLYGLDPQFAVTFNRKDYLRYKEQYHNHHRLLLGRLAGAREGHPGNSVCCPAIGRSLASCLFRVSRTDRERAGPAPRLSTPPRRYTGECARQLYHRLTSPRMPAPNDLKQ